MKFVLLNGPPGCGKDTAASHLIPYINFKHLKFAAPIKRMVAGLLDCSMSELEKIKDIPNRMLRYENYVTHRDATPRQLLIALSEELFKPTFGGSFFGNALWCEACISPAELFIVSDCGFSSEVERLISNAGKSNCLLIRIHREGHTFDGDSRSYLPDGLCKTIDIHNDLTPHDLTMRVLSATIRTWKHIELLREPEWIKE